MFGYILREVSILVYGIEEGGLVRPVRFPYPEKNQETRIELPKDPGNWTAEGLGITVGTYPVRMREDECQLVFRYSLLDSAKNHVCTLLPLGAPAEDPVLDVRDLDVVDFLSFQASDSGQEDTDRYTPCIPVDHHLYVWEDDGGYLT